MSITDKIKIGGVRHDVEKSARKATKKTRKSLRRHPKTWGAAAAGLFAATAAGAAALVRRRTS